MTGRECVRPVAGKRNALFDRATTTDKLSAAKPSGEGSGAAGRNRAGGPMKKHLL